MRVDFDREVWTRPRRRLSAPRYRERQERRRRSHGAPETVIRVRFWRKGQLYAYSVRGSAQVGSIVEVDSPYSGTVALRVVALGRGGYSGPLRFAKLVNA